MEEGPAGLVWQILEDRAYVTAYQQMKRAENDENAEIDDSPLTELVQEIAAEVDGEIADEVLGRKRSG